MKEQDKDWLVYHLIPQCGQVTDTTIATESGLSLADVRISLERLERYCLIEVQGDTVRLLSFGEALIKNNVKYEEGLPFVIENGVIKERKK